MIWTRNFSGIVSIRPYAFTLRANSSHNYQLVNGMRRLTPQEMLRLQGFPDSFDLTGSYTQSMRLIGNSLPVPVAKAVLFALLRSQLLGKRK